MAKARAKGARTELEAAHALSKALGQPIHRNHREQAHGGGEDLVGPVLRHFAIECKSADPPRFKEWLEQAEAQAGENQVPVLMQWRPRQPWRCLVILEVGQLADYVRWTNHVRDGRL